MKNLLLLSAIFLLIACSQNSGKPNQANQSAEYPVFRFSNEPFTMDVRDPNNWCAASFGEAALISADPQNFNRRVFALGEVPCKVVLEMGHFSAVFMLAKSGNQVDLYTSDNLPACLSNKSNFHISPEGVSFRYDNKKEINFDVYLHDMPNGWQITIDLPPNSGYGLSAIRCETCK